MSSQPFPVLNTRQRKLSRRTGALLTWYSVMLVALLSVSMHADTIPAAGFSGNSNNVQITGPGTYVAGNTTVTEFYQNGEASISGNGFTIGDTTSGGGGDVSFRFEVVGSKSESVPLLYTAQGSTSISGGGAFANVQFESPAGTLIACSTAPGGTCAGGSTPSFSSTLQGTVTPGTIYEIDVVMNGSSAFTTGTWAASVDPQVAIDPSFVDFGDFTLEFSPNPPSAAPEPSSLLLLGTGLIGGIRAMRRRVPK